MALPASDNFNRANGGLGANWSTITGWTAPQIAGNLVEPGAAGGTDSAARWNADAFGNDQFSQITVVNAGSSTNDVVGVVVRAAAAANTFYQALVRGPIGASCLIQVRKVVAGTITVLGTTLAPVAVGDTFRLTVVGTTLTATVNGVLRVEVGDSAIAAGSAGIYLFDAASVTSAQLDNWSGGTPAVTTHTLTDSGSVAISSPSFLSIAITGRPSRLTSGAANPPNWYHVGMLSWGTGNGAMTAYPVTRDADLVALPANMTTLWYEFVSGVTAVVTELAAP